MQNKRVGIFGKPKDSQTKHVREMLEARGAKVTLIETNAFAQEIAHTMEGTRCDYHGEDLSEIRAYWLRYIQAPMAPAIREDGELRLHQDWFLRYMRQREREAYVLSWLRGLLDEGKTLINPPVSGHVSQLKPYQLQCFFRHGLPAPRTLISNSPEAVRAFYEEIDEVIFKPAMGGGYCEQLTEQKLAQLTQIRSSPVIFQERIRGEDIRVMVLDDAVISSVVVEVEPDIVDFRTDQGYSSGRGTYREITLPVDVQAMCVKAAAVCDLRFAGIDLKHTPKGEFRILECNSSPIYLDVELKMKHPISERLVETLLAEA